MPKSDKVLFVIYAELELLIKTIDTCKNNPKNSFTIKVNGKIPSGFSMSKVSLFKSISLLHIYIYIQLILLQQGISKKV